MFLCLLPGYRERTGSSLVYMMEHFVKMGLEGSDFFLGRDQTLFEQLLTNREKDVPTVLFGVSFGLLDFVEQYQMSFPNLIVMETGGMKGRRAEMHKDQLHSILKQSFDVNRIHSEYGMTELFSQSYSKGDGLFFPPSTKQIFISEITDPFTEERNGKTGILNIIDLANIDSVSFIQTQDLAVKNDNGSFYLQGRLDHADIRGCNLMIQ